MGEILIPLDDERTRTAEETLAFTRDHLVAMLRDQAFTVVHDNRRLQSQIIRPTDRRHRDVVVRRIMLPWEQERFTRRLTWYELEVDRLRAQQLEVPTHYHALEDITDETDRPDIQALFKGPVAPEEEPTARHILYTVVSRLPGAELKTNDFFDGPIHNGRLKRLGKRLIAYYTDPTRPEGTPVIADISHLRQWVHRRGRTRLRDLDPLVSPSTSTEMSEVLSWLGSLIGYGKYITLSYLAERIQIDETETKLRKAREARLAAEAGRLAE